MIFDFEDYMKQVAIAHKTIAHIEGDHDNTHYFLASSTGNVEELLQKITKISGINLAIEDNFEAPIVENASGHLMYRQLCSYFLLKKFSVNDMEDRNIILKQLITVNEDIVSRLRRDYKSDQAGETDLSLFGLEFNSFSFFTFGPILNNLLGLHCSFTLLKSAKIEYNIDNWNS